MGTINLAIAGATGWTGSAIVDGALAAPDITLKSAIARRSAGQDLGTALGREPLGVPVYADVGEALDGVDVLVEFTSHTHAKEIALAAIERGVAVVIGSSGLTADDFKRSTRRTRRRGRRRRGRQLQPDRRDDARRRRARRPPPPAMGDHRLRQVDQARRPERHRP